MATVMASPAADAEPVQGHQLVAGEADQPGHHHPADPIHRGGVEDPVERLPGGGRRRDGDGGHDEHARQVLGAAVAVGVAVVCRPPTEPEGQPEGNGGEGVGKVVDGVGKEGHRSAGQDHDQLDAGGRGQDGQGDPQGPHPLPAGGHGPVDRFGGVVAVGPQQALEQGPEAVIMPVVMVVPRLGVGVAGVHGSILPDDRSYRCRTAGAEGRERAPPLRSGWY
jgi:hypothetical protein